MSIKLLLHHVLVKASQVDETDEVIRRAKAAGIQVQLDQREKKAVEYGTVLQVGPTAFKDYGRGPDILKVGDTVSFAKYAGKAVKDKDQEYLLLNDEDVLCVIGDDNG